MWGQGYFLLYRKNIGLIVKTITSSTTKALPSVIAVLNNPFMILERQLLKLLSFTLLYRGN